MANGPDLGDFAGHWQLSRQILDRILDQTVVFEGQATFVPEAGGLAYAETGLLRIPGQSPIPADRRYLWRPVAEGIAVFFEDGRPFHVIGPGLQPVAHHDCAPDTYEVCYDFRAWPRWSADWNVSGPRKDYTMQSVYERV